MKSRLLAVALSTVGMLSAATNGPPEMATVVVSASRVGDQAAEMPSAVQVITAADIARTGAQDLPELLSRQANLQVRTLNSNPLQAQLALRGFGENSFGRVRIVVDGEELNSVDMEAPNLARIPLGSIERVEIIRGPSPVLYGDGAVAGVINVITAARDCDHRTKLAVRGGAYGTFGLNVQTRGGLADEGIRYSGSYDYGRSDGYRQRSGYDLHSVVAGVHKDFANGSTIGVKGNYSNALYQMPGALDWYQWQRDPRQARYQHDWCRVWNYGIALDSKLKLADEQWLYLDAAFSVKHRKSHWGDYGYANEYDLYGYQLSPRYVNEQAWWSFDDKFTLGTDFRYERYAVTDRSGYNNPDYHFDRWRVAPFAQDEFFVTDELSVLAGARFECIYNRWTNYRGLAETASRDAMGDFELGLVYRPVDGLKTYVKGTRFHRSAFCDELNYTEDGKFLNPETGTSLDVGSDWAITQELNFDLNGYWTVTEDEIFYNPHAHDYGYGYWGGYNCNSPGATERLGFDTALTWRRERMAEAAVRYGFVQAHFADGQYQGASIPLVPESRVRVEAGFWLFADLEIKGGFRHVASQVLAGDFDNSHDLLAGYSLFDVGAYYQPSWTDGWRVSLVVDNLLDRDYCDFAGWSDYAGAYYYPACGRSFMVTVSYEF